MANLLSKSTNTTPASGDYAYVVDDPGGTPADTKATLGNVITKAHGLSDGAVKVASGVMTTGVAVDDLSDVTITSLISGQVLKYDGAAWINDSASGANAFTTFAADSGTSPQPDTTTDTITIAGGTGISTTGNATSDTVTIDIDSTVATLTGPQTLADKTLITPIVGDFTSATHTHQDNAGGGTLNAAAIAAGTVATARLGSGTANSGSYLRGDQTWAAIAAGQVVYDHIVAASGGTHTTLGAAITAAASGDTIYVRSGTYAESAITSSTTNLTIIGESRETSIVSMGSNAITLSGTGLQLINIQFQATTGIQTYSGTNKNILSSTFSHAAGTGGCVFSGTGANISNSRFICTGTTGFRVYQFNSSRGNVTGSYFSLARSSSAGTQGAIEFGGDHINVSGNYFDVTLGFDVDKPVVGLGNTNTSLNVNFTSNTIYVAGTACIGILSNSGNVNMNITGNSLYGVGFKGIECASTYANISSNSIYMSTNSAANYGVYLNGADCLVASNQFYGPGTTAAAAVFIASAIDNTVVSSNKVYRYSVGVHVNSSCDNTIVSGNLFSATLTPITDSGTGTQSDNNVSTVASLINTTKRHVYMKNTSGGSLAAGDVVVWKAVANGDEVTTTTTAGDDKIFGVAIEAITNNTYGRIQTLGKNTQMKVDGTTDIAIGDPITTFTTAGIGAKAAAGDMIIGYALEAFTTDASSGVIDVLLISPRLI